ALPPGRSRAALVTEVATQLAGLPAEAAVVVGCSGGPDSTALAFLAAEARPDLRLTLVHVAHGLRSAEVEDAEALIDRVKGMLTRGEEPDFPDGAEDLEAIQGVANYPVRIKCALLSWNTLGQIVGEMRGESSQR
ncbi:MAG: ATP-binding protein, partial [Spirochaetota bacterium]